MTMKIDGAEHGQAAEHQGLLLLAGLRRAHAHRHRPRAQQQHRGVDRAELPVELLAAEPEGLGVHLVVVEVGGEQTAEEQDFRRQEQPEAQLRRLELLHRRVEVVRHRVGNELGSRGRDHYRVVTVVTHLGIL
jgi:hypothetical protein